jgi:hypothetical protein
MNEIDLIKQRYEKRKSVLPGSKHKTSFHFDYFMQSEREMIYLKIIKSIFAGRDDIKLIEIGAGMGTNIYFFLKHGIKSQNIYANELLDDRLKVLHENLPFIQIIPGDASKLEYQNEFDIVFQSTVFTSILNIDLKTEIAERMWKMKKENGIVLWYDFIYDNPNNKDVKGISKKEILQLFPNAQNVTFYPVTLAPFIGRRTGKFYHHINMFFPLLRTHIIALIY